MGRSLFAGETISKNAITRSPLTWRIVSVRRISRAAEDTVSLCRTRGGASATARPPSPAGGVAGEGGDRSVKMSAMIRPPCCSAMA